jgi:hypothetical protein
VGDARVLSAPYWTADKPAIDCPIGDFFGEQGRTMRLLSMHHRRDQPLLLPHAVSQVSADR